MQKINRAIISVSDKQDVIELAQLLQNCGIEIISTGGTAKYLQNHGIKITKISDVTGFPEIMDGRVKTLHPKIHGGILARGDQDTEAIQQHDIINIDLIIVNLYPFAQVVNKADCTLTEAVENIDIGGPTMIRAAAKNFNYKTVLVDPEDYELIITDIATTGTIPLETRFKLAAKAFAYTASYEDKIANYFGRLDNPDAKPVKFPQTVNRQFVKSQDLRYGENPHQQAAFYIDALQPAAMATAKQIQGKQLSFNNLIDADAAWSCVQEFADTACVIVKHANPCGVAIANNLLEAYDKAFNTDPKSAFGGIIAVNRTIEAKLANYIINQQFAEVIVAPDIDSEAQQIFKQKNNVRVLIVPQPDLGLNYEVKPVNGGLLIQHKDQHQLTLDDIKIVTARKPTEKELTDLLFSWKVAKFVKSNAIVYAKNSQTIGIGAGQMSRVYSAKIANLKAVEHKHDVANSVMASDAFFPFKDGIETAASLGITAVIQPGGSIRDAEVIAAANKANMAMVFTNIRHFRH